MYVILNSLCVKEVACLHVSFQHLNSMIAEVTFESLSDHAGTWIKVSALVLPYFNTITTKLIEERGTVEVVLEALMYISGVATEIKSRSLLSSQPVSYSLHNVNVWYEKISLNFDAAEYDYICKYLNFTHNEII